MATTKVLLDKRRPLKDDTYPLVIRIYKGGKYSTISLKIYLKPNQFDPQGQKVIGNHPNKKEINQKIKQSLIKLEKANLDLELREEIISADKIKTTAVKLRGQNEFNNSVSTINPIEVFEVNNYISIRDLEEALPVDFVGSNGKRLIETLANLSEDDRTQKIRYYNKEVNQKRNNNKRNAPWIDLGIGGLEDIIGNATGFPALGLAGAILKLAGSRLFKSKSTFRGLLDKLESSIHSDADKANIHYLTSINRVARIKEYP